MKSKLLLIAIICFILSSCAVTKDYEYAVSRNSVSTYENFKRNYPKSKYTFDINERIQLLVDEKNEWSSASRMNTLGGYKKYTKKFPNGENIEIANKRIIDLEVEDIFNGKYGDLPQMSKSAANSRSLKTINTLTVTNSTPYTLTVFYSGIESKKLVLLPEQSQKITLKKGKYKVAANVKAANVRNFAGEKDLDGGDYTIEYYIEKSFR